MRVIAIDGPGGSGKSTISRALAGRLGLPRLDTGAMYRAVALLALRAGVELGDGEGLTRLATEMALCVCEGTWLNGEDVTAEIRTATIDACVSAVARQPGVRTELVRRQRAWAEAHGGGVIEGRDIGSVVFPDASVKIYLTASTAERAVRRQRERVDSGELAAATVEQTAAAMAHRDETDSSRATSPLVVAKGAHVIDSTGKSVDAVLDAVLRLL